MAPRKKRSRAAAKAKTVTKKPDTDLEEPQTINEENLSEPIPSTVKTKIASKHKKFGKFRCLIEDTSNCSEIKEPKEIDDISNLSNDSENITNTVSLQNNDVESSVIVNETDPVLETTIASENIEQSETVTENNMLKFMEVECNENENSTNLENLATEISQQLSSLNVETEIDSNNEVKEMESTIIENVPVVDETKDVSTNDDYNVSVNSEFTVECITEEDIPIADEQEVEIPIATEAIQDESTIINAVTELTESIAIKEESENVEELVEKFESNVKVKTSKVPKQKCNKVKPANTKKKEAATTLVKADKRQQKIKTKSKKNSPDSKKSLDLENSVRRSSRIKSISVLKQRTKGQGLVKPKIETEIKKITFNDSDHSENSNSCHTDSEKTSTDSPGFLTPSSGYDSDHKPVKVKSRWRRSSELEMGNTHVSSHNTDNNNKSSFLAPLTENAPLTTQSTNVTDIDKKAAEEEIKSRLKQFTHLKENLYLTERVVCKEAKKMTCDCFLTPEETERGEMGCGEDCLNRLLMIECGQFCPVNDRCTNKRFQKAQFSPCEVFRTDKKGLGIRATTIIPTGEFILEYIGEVIGPDEFEDRATEYSKDKNPHYYFMSLRSDAVIDATQKGNISRFINHSCEPNAETQKWTVNGELRIGFFSKRTIAAGEEITFDYQFQRYGKEAQKCFCEAPTCRGWLGEEPDDDEDEDEENDEEEEEEPEKITESQSLQTTDKAHEQLAKKDAEATEKTNADVVATVTRTTDTKKTIKKEKKKAIRRKVSAKNIFDDLDVDQEIEILMTTGLKNQAHTLKLSRLMVRANNASQRTTLLRILRHGEFPCRRLFLDYHGLRLIHGWMNDAQQLCKTDIKQESLRLELLQTLATLPISNKTILQDSKVLSTVEKWSSSLKDVANDALDSENNSPKTETDVAATSTDVNNTKTDVKEEIKTETPQDDKIEKDVPQLPNGDTSPITQEENEDLNDDIENIRKSVGMEIDAIREKYGWYLPETSKRVVEDIIDLFNEDVELIPIKIKPKQEEKDYEVEIIALALKLLEEWSVLKEVFRIPKKERIEQMKEHEREANRGYKATLENDAEGKLVNRYRMLQRRRIEKLDSSERNKKISRPDGTLSFLPRISKHERRKLFAMKVEQEEVERRNRELWRQHELSMAMGGSVYDPNRNVSYMWNSQTPQWPNYSLTPMINPIGPRFNATVPYSYASTMPPAGMIPTIPPVGNPALAPQTAVLSVPPPGIAVQRPTLPLPPDMSQPPPHINISTNIPPPNVHPYSGMHLTPTIPLSNETSTQEIVSEKDEDPTLVKFSGPIPPPVKLPPKWRCAKDKYGRPYYYHIKIRMSQWEPPELLMSTEIDESSDSTSSTETSSLSSDSSSEESDDDETDDTKLLLEIRKKFQLMDSRATATKEQDTKKNSPDDNSPVTENDETNSDARDINKTSSLDERLREEFNLSRREALIAKEAPVKQKRKGLVTEVHIISPRSEEDKVLAKENLRKYKENKERLKRKKEANMDQSKKRIKVTVKADKKSAVKTKSKEVVDSNSEAAKRIKETFRSNMASIMVGILNPYRKSDCKEGKITNVDDFKHLAKKLTHFVMVKELKHIQNIEDLMCTESVKNKAKEFVRKYMSKFGENYIRPKDDPEY